MVHCQEWSQTIRTGCAHHFRTHAAVSNPSRLVSNTYSLLKVKWKWFIDMIGNLISKILLLLQNNIKMLVNKAIFLVTNNIKAQMFTLYYKWILVAPSIIILIKLWNFRHLTLDSTRGWFRYCIMLEIIQPF